MKALALVPGSTDVHLTDRPEPGITRPDEIKLKVLEVGICGTDREEAAGGRADAPAGQRELVIGHEMLGQVIEVGSAVKKVRPGDRALFTVRRGCGHCPACAMNRSDMCYSGDYTERGVKGRDGYETELVVDTEQYVVKVPEEIADIGVLSEPMSVAETAIDEAVLIQNARLPDSAGGQEWLKGRRALVAGLGPVGLLAAFALRLRGAEVLGLDVVERDSPRARCLEGIGGQYVDGRQVTPANVEQQCPGIELIFEATGVASLEFDLIDALGINGIYMITGIPGGDRPLSIDGAELIRRMVLDNQVMAGSVNAAPKHFDMAVADLAAARQRWPQLIAGLITDRLPYGDYHRALFEHQPDEIKTVLRWDGAGETSASTCSP